MKRILLGILLFSWWNVAPVLAQTWPNEPAGFTTFGEASFNSGIPSGCNSLPYNITSDATAPISPPGAWTASFPANFPDSTGVANFECNGSGGNAGYLGTMWKMDLPNGPNFVTANKLTFLVNGGAFETLTSLMIGCGNPRCWVLYIPSNVFDNCHIIGAQYASYSDDCHIPAQGHTVEFLSPLAGPQPGVWYKIEQLFKPSTTLTSRDGIYKVWINGQVAFDIQNLNSNFLRGTWPMFLDPTSGGGQPVAYNFYYDHAHFSTGNYQGGSSGDTTPPSQVTGVTAIPQP